MGFLHMKGATVNASGTLIATARPIGTNKMDLTDASLDHGTSILYGNETIPIHEAIRMGLLWRDATNTLVELNQAQPATRTNA
jgi:hypothetical protein